MTLSNRLKEIKERCEAATPGPWWLEREGVYVWGIKTWRPNVFHNGKPMTPMNIPLVSPVMNGVTQEYYIPNNEFIAHSRTDIPFLLAELERRDEALSVAMQRLEWLNKRLFGHQHPNGIHCMSCEEFNSIKDTLTSITAILSGANEKGEEK